MAAMYAALSRRRSCWRSRSACSPASAPASLIGVVNGIGVAVFGVSPFMMTLGMASVGFGIALYPHRRRAGLRHAGGVRQVPRLRPAARHSGADLSSPIALIVVMYVLLNRTRMGRYFYAVGGNLKAAQLSGINTRLTCS